MVDAAALDRLKDFCVLEQLAETAKKAVEACGIPGDQACYICLDDGGSEGLVRMCACRGNTGVAHLSCLVKQAQLATEKDGSDTESTDSEDDDWPSELWDTCGLCEQEHHGLLKCALGWACWNTYGSLPEHRAARRGALTILGNGLLAASYYDEALVAYQCCLVQQRNMGGSVVGRCWNGNLAVCFQKLGRHAEALSLQREVYALGLTLGGTIEERAYDAANLAEFLVDAGEFDEAKAFMRSKTPSIKDSLGSDHCAVLDLETYYGRGLFTNPDAINDDLVEAESVLDDVLRRCQRILGTEHPDTRRARELLDGARKAQTNDGARLKKRCAAHFTKIHSNPLEYCEKNCLLYEQGRIDLVWRDWQLLGDAKTKAKTQAGEPARAARGARSALPVGRFTRCVFAFVFVLIYV